MLSEQPAATQKAVDGLLPAITTGVVNQTRTQEGAATLYRLLQETSFATDPSAQQLVQTDAHLRKAAESGNSLLKKLYGEPVHRLTEAVTQYSGVGLGSAATISGLVMSVLMGLLNKDFMTGNSSPAQFATALRTGTDLAVTRAAIPAALVGLLGWFIGDDTVRPVTTTPINRPEPVVRPADDQRAAAFPWLRWLLIGLGLLLLLWLLLRGCNSEKKTAATAGAVADTTMVSADTVASDVNGNELARADTTQALTDGPDVRVGVDLPGGRKLNVTEKSFNYALATFLSTKGGKVPKVFTFDNLTFESNSAQITAKARPNVEDLIQIMQAYPTLAIRIEGNTDSTGDDAVNDPLSAQRAQAVKDALVKAGIAASRVVTRELGDSKPVASNSTEAGREKNRRIDVVVTKL